MPQMFNVRRGIGGATMRFAANVIWFVLGGAVTALIWLIGAVVFAVSIVGIPMTRAAIEMAKLSAWPFGREVVHIRELDGRGLDGATAITGTVGFVANIVWALTFGLLLFLYYLAAGIVLCVTLIGIPFGLQSFKLAGISLWPVGRRVVTAELARVARRHKADEDFARHRNKAKHAAPASTAALDRRVGGGETLRAMEPALLPGPSATPTRRASPPQLAPDKGWFVEVVGESNYQTELNQAGRSAKQQYDDYPLVGVTLEPEDGNPYDANAVRVDSTSGTLGYLPRELAHEYRAAMGARRATCTGIIYGGDDVDDEGNPHLFGVWLNAMWPPRYK